MDEVKDSKTIYKLHKEFLLDFMGVMIRHGPEQAAIMFELATQDPDQFERILDSLKSEALARACGKNNSTQYGTTAQLTKP